MKTIQAIFVSMCLTLALCVPAMAEDAAPKSSVLITGANIFDGTSEKLATGMSVLAEATRSRRSPNQSRPRSARW